MKHHILPKNVRLQILLQSIAFVIIFCFALSSFIEHSEAAVAPNKQAGTCGQYYLWYQMSAEDYSYPMDYVYLCSITFDIIDVTDDFDFVYFIDSVASQRALLDQNSDGISDSYFFGRSQNHIVWKPDGGCIRINLRECQGNKLNERCGYAMISVQPKPGFRNGSARIPIRVVAQCPNGSDCSKNYIIVHEYSDCVKQAVPDFIMHKQVDTFYLASSRPEFDYEITVQNTTTKKSSITLIDTISEGTNGGELRLSEIKITTCPTNATCTLSSVTNKQIQILFTNFPPNGKAIIAYKMKAENIEIPREEVSYFTNTATLSNGSSAQVTVGIKGSGPRRPERPIDTRRGHP